MSESPKKVLRVLPVRDGFVVDDRTTHMTSLRRPESRIEGIVRQHTNATTFKNESKRVHERNVWCHDDYLSHPPAPTDLAPLQIMRTGPRRL